MPGIPGRSSVCKMPEICAADSIKGLMPCVEIRDTPPSGASTAQSVLVLPASAIRIGEEVFGISKNALSL